MPIDLDVVRDAVQVVGSLFRSLGEAFCLRFLFVVEAFPAEKVHNLRSLCVVRCSRG